MANDDPRKRPRRGMTDDDRALAGLDRRQVGSKPAIQLPVDDEITDPGASLAGGLTDFEIELLRRLRTSADAPATMGDIAKVLSREHSHAVDYRSSEREIGAQIASLRELITSTQDQQVIGLQQDLDELRCKIDTSSSDVEKLKTESAELRSISESTGEVTDKIKRSATWARNIAISAALAAVGSIGTFAAKVWEKAEAEGENVVRLSHLERDLLQLRADFRELSARAISTPKDLK